MDIEKIIKLGNESREIVERNGAFVEQARATANLHLPAVRALQENGSVQRMLESIATQEDLFRQYADPLQELRAAGVFDLESGFHRELRQAQDMLSAYTSRFTLPDMGAVNGLLEKIKRDALFRESYLAEAESLRKAIEAMHSPWLDQLDAMRSLHGLAGVQGIGNLLGQMTTYDDDVAASLRVGLGDWRDPITWSDDVISSLPARSDFYVQLGFDRTLVDFPAAAFDESVEIAGLRGELPPLVEAYGPPIPWPDDAEEQAALGRTNVAHDWLQRLETNLRRFIDAVMTQAFGADWPRRRLPNGMYEKWAEKKRAAEKERRGRWPLIAFADFTDYGLIICRKDNWREVFSGYFMREETVRESFQRLHPIRLDTMHARPIGQEDELLLYVEIRRLMRSTLI